jgi:hypothetical protein
MASNPQIPFLHFFQTLAIPLRSPFIFYPCCSNVTHTINFTASSYLPALGANIFCLRDYVRDALFIKRMSNFQVLCQNRMLGIGPHLSDEAAIDIGGMWGKDPVDPSAEAYRVIAQTIEDNALSTDARYTNPPRSQPSPLPKGQIKARVG